jgi:undecaprenyl-diphosphatase
VLLAAVGLLLLARQPGWALLVLAAGGGGTLVNSGLKHLFARERPNLVPWLTNVGSASFPSGHAMLSAAVYLSIAVLFARVVQRRRLKLYVLAVAAILVLLVGATRVMLGVHYPTDVAAGWLAGGLWALLCGVATEALVRRGTVERPEASAAGSD